MTAFVVFLVVVIGVPLTTSFVLSAMAKQQKDIVVGVPVAVATTAVQDAFRGMGWTETHGKGALNFRCRGFGLSSMAIKTKPVLSIAFADAGGGATQVSVWLSEWGTSWAQMGCCDRVVLKRRKVVKALESLTPTVGGLATGQWSAGPGAGTPGAGTPSAGNPGTATGRVAGPQGQVPTFGPPPSQFGPR